MEEENRVIIISIILAILMGFLGSWLLQKEEYKSYYEGGKDILVNGLKCWREND